MTTAPEAAVDLLAALKTVQGVRLYADLGATIEVPAAVLDAPSFVWDGLPSEPTSATFRVYVVVKNDERAMPRLWALVPAVARAIDLVQGAVVMRADPGRFLTGGDELPCYEIEVEVAL